MTSHYRSNERLGLPPEVTDPNGRTFEATVKDFKIGHSDKLGKLVILHDVSERKKMEEIVRNAEAEKKMAESNRKYRTVVDNQTEAIVSFLPDGKITFMNGIMERYLSYLGPGSSDDLRDLMLKDVSERMFKQIDLMTPDGPMMEYETSLKRTDGEILHILWRGKGIFDNRGKLKEVQAVGINITELRRLETEMARADKLESLGVLAGGIAHDFNNMLASIVTNVEIAIQDIPEDVRSRHHLEASVRSAMRARNLTQQLLTFSKGGEPVKEVIDLAPLARSSVDFMLSGTNAAAVYGFEDGEYYANVDPIQIEQVIGNLAMNASQAMPKGGHIYVNMKKLSDPDIDLLSIRPGPYIRIDVRDEGCGSLRMFWTKYSNHSSLRRKLEVVSGSPRSSPSSGITKAMFEWIRR